jgi:hypothetical protein
MELAVQSQATSQRSARRDEVSDEERAWLDERIHEYQELLDFLHAN